MNSGKPLVSVIITTFNSEKFISDTIKSVLNQTFQDFEIIIVDDGSDDKTVEIINQFSLKYPGIYLHAIPHSGSPSVVRNIGIKKADGKYIAFLDGDDLWEKNKLADQIKILEKNNEAVLAYSISLTFGDVNIFSPYYEVFPLPYKSAKTRDELVQKGNSIPLSAAIVRKEFLNKIGGFDEDPQLKIEDFDLWLRLSELGNFIFIPRIHTYYRIHSNQFSADWETKKKRLEYLAEKRGLNLPPYRFYRNKGFIFLFIRNFIHFSTYLGLKLLMLIRKD